MAVSSSYAVSESSKLYELDFYAWTQQQAKFLRERDWSCLDVENLVEEIESLGKQERRELRNRLKVLLGHLLKWEFQVNYRCGSWLNTIQEQRDQIGELLEDSPTLKPYLAEILQKAYPKAVDLASRETSLEREAFPLECSYSLEEILNFSFLPGQQLDSDNNIEF